MRRSVGETSGVEEIVAPEGGEIREEFVRRLTSQLALKENAIQLLRLQINNLKEELERRGGGGEQAHLDVIASKDARIRELEREIERLRKQRSGSGAPDDQVRRFDAVEAERLRKEAAELSRRASALEEELEAAGKRIERLEAEKAELESRVSEAERAVGVREEELRKRLEAYEQELSSLRETLKDREEKLERLRSELKESISLEALDVLGMVMDLSDGLERAALDGEIGAEVAAPLLKLVVELRERLGLRRIDEIGVPFDENVHQEVGKVHRCDLSHRTVAEVMNPGYEHRGAVLKIADVIVNSHPYWCAACSHQAPVGSRFCNLCGGRLEGGGEPLVSDEETVQRLAALLKRASSLELQGKYAEALASYEEAAELSPDDVSCLKKLAMLYEKNAEYGKALLCHERLRELGAADGQLRRSEERVRLKLDIVERLRKLS